MSTLVPIPKLGQSEETVKIEKWRVKEGDLIKKGDVLFELETDKAVLEVESQFEGTLLKITVPEGMEVPVMSVAAILGTPGEKIPEIKIEKTQKEEPQKTVVPVSSAPAPISRQKVPDKRKDIDERADIVLPGWKPKPSPRARMFAKNYLINLDDVQGTGGKNGRVTEADVKKYLSESGYLEKKITPAAFNLAKKEKLFLLDIEGSGEEKRITLDDVKSAAMEKPKDLSAIRKIIAKRLTDSKRNIPHFYVTMPIDMTRAQNIRKKMKEEGNTISLNDFVVKATALALKEFSMMNAECIGEKIKYKTKINIGIAISLENGLVVPVIKNTDKKALDEIHAEISELTEKARAGKLSPEKMKGGTFTISNMGMFGVENFAAIINPGESAILAVSSSAPSPVATKDGKIEVKEIMKITVSADHRIVDGVDAAKFANSIKAKLEDPSCL
jgi:pyruvate dehydrogenase E2 component (dihydrolipoamide acetyltransferase)